MRKFKKLKNLNKILINKYKKYNNKTFKVKII